MDRKADTPQSVETTGPGVRMAYRFSAESLDIRLAGDPVVLVHGLSVSSGYMVPTMRALTEQEGKDVCARFARFWQK